MTFKRFADAWVAREAKATANWKGWTPDYTEEVKASLRNHLSDLDGIPLTTITAALVEPSLAKVERDAPMMLEKVHRRLRVIMDEAARKGLIPINPLPPPRRRSGSSRRHYPAVTDLPGLGAILRDARASDPCKGIQRAHLLLAFTGLRVSEVVGAQWSEFDLDGVDVPIVGDLHRTRHAPDAGNWRVPRSRMKREDTARGDHIVPLPPLLLAELRRWREADGNGAVYVCPAPRDPAKHITPEGCEKWMRDALKLGGKHSPHSWRAAFKSVCADAGKSKDATEAQLDHVIGTSTESAYDRAKRLELRRELVTWYEGALVAARDGAAVLPLKGRGARS
jgi:integrase